MNGIKTLPTNLLGTNMVKSWGLGIALGFLLGIITPIAKADYIYEANQDLYDLQTNSSGSTGLGSNDDSVSAAFNLGFTFTLMVMTLLKREWLLMVVYTLI